MRFDEAGASDSGSERDGVKEAEVTQKLSEVVEDQPDGASGPEGVEGLESAVHVALRQEIESLQDRHLRLAAEFDNYRRRTERERAESRDRAQAQLVGRLLEPLDDLQRVSQFSDETVSVQAVLEGVRMVERKLGRVLEAAGLEVVDARGQRFDPQLHEAVMMVATDRADEDDTVGEVFQPGYTLRGVLIRPARVQVRKHGG